MSNHTPVTAWAVYWVRGGRIGSFPLDSKEHKEFSRMFHLSLIQKDITGTEHLTVWGEIKRSKKRTSAQGKEN